MVCAAGPPPPKRPPPQPEPVHFEGDRGWAVGAEGTILATGDAGSTWHRQAAATRTTLTCVRAGTGGAARVIGRAGTVLTTKDGGVTWETRDSGTDVSLWGVAFTASGEHGWAVGDDGGTVRATKDGGATWDQHFYSPEKDAIPAR
ncbi:WD40/YVTN/BNR-like repeat-containing protein [Streptomyces coeruleorubidus]|uniref:WD40/YVTN/BNR-like repeat-containing protein n=1 Tax=Streptomyces coeruleorubidus TaxID=116188 RepID=UPI0033A7010D